MSEGAALLLALIQRYLDLKENKTVDIKRSQDVGLSLQLQYSSIDNCRGQQATATATMFIFFPFLLGVEHIYITLQMPAV